MSRHSQKHRDSKGHRPLRFHTNRQTPFHRLPFVAGKHHHSHSKFWNVPGRGGYEGGFDTGESLGFIFLRHLRDHPEEIPGRLGLIVESMMYVYMEECRHALLQLPKTEWPYRLRSRRGQLLGFFAVMEEWLMEAVAQRDPRQSSVPEEALVELANQGLNRNE